VAAAPFVSLRNPGVGLVYSWVNVYSVSTVYVIKVMKSGHVLRVSIPRLVQRHLGLRAGDLLALELSENGELRGYKLDQAKVRGARATLNPAGPDRPAV
jgi:antitoxin component of MazEF toxin-antitoxin module